MLENYTAIHKEYNLENHMSREKIKLQWNWIYTSWYYIKYYINMQYLQESKYATFSYA